MNKVFLQCASQVDKSAISRTSINGVEHIIVQSFTMPDDIVMNGGLYPAAEIAKSFKTLERTLAPIEHPHIDGQFLSASDPVAIHNFHAGAFNVNVKQVNGRVSIEKHINVQEAMKSDRGLRLLDRIKEIETNSNPRPIHTSVGVYLVAEKLKEPMTNAAGLEYSWVASDMTFDHDAILLDSVGAATPNQGVGLAVNSKGDNYYVQTFVLNEAAPLQPIIANTVIIPTITKGDAMKTLILNALTDAKIATDGLDDAALLSAYDVLKTNKVEVLPANLNEIVANAVAEAIKPVVTKLSATEALLNANADAELNALADIVGSSDKYPAIDSATAKLLGVNKLKELAANCGHAYGISPTVNASEKPAFIEMQA